MNSILIKLCLSLTPLPWNLPDWPVASGSPQQGTSEFRVWSNCGYAPLSKPLASNSSLGLGTAGNTGRESEASSATWQAFVLSLFPHLERRPEHHRRRCQCRLRQCLPQQILWKNPRARWWPMSAERTFWPKASLRRSHFQLGTACVSTSWSLLLSLNY